VLLCAPPASPAGAIPPCAEPGSGWCVARRIAGDVPGGELGFRFGEPLDVDGDGQADIAAGARFAARRPTVQYGRAAVWSGATGAPIRAWDGEQPDALFGHWVLPLPDLDGDGLADVVVASPTARVDGAVRGMLSARSPAAGGVVWTRVGRDTENLGWDLAPAGDVDGDGRVDLFAGAPSLDGGRVYVVSGRDGAFVRTLAPPAAVRSFGWYVARVDDADGDGRPDVAVGAPIAKDAAGAPCGAAFVLSSTTGAELRRWTGTEPLAGFGEIVAALPDADGDAMREVAVASPRTNDQTRARPGEVRVFAGATGAELRRWEGTQPGELFGRMVVATGDLDGDGGDDVAIGAPWHRRAGDARVGRVELRSGRSGAVLHELVGDGPDSWFGWHIRRAPDPAGQGRPTLLVASLRHPAGGAPGTGAVDLIVFRGQGTSTRETRRSDMR